MLLFVLLYVLLFVLLCLVFGCLKIVESFSSLKKKVLANVLKSFMGESVQANVMESNRSESPFAKYWSRSGVKM